MGEGRARVEALAVKEKAVTELTAKVEELIKELEGSKARIAELEKAAVPAPTGAGGDNAELVSHSMVVKGNALMVDYIEG
jgi:hypothetical protein